LAWRAAEGFFVAGLVVATDVVDVGALLLGGGLMQSKIRTTLAADDSFCVEAILVRRFQFQ